jgi:hypothetical protein
MHDFEKYKLTDKEKMIYELLEAKLDRIIELLERQGSVRPG